MIITTSPPPLVSIPGWIIAKCKGAKLVYDVRDIWPDVALEMGSFAEGSIYCKVFRAITRFMYKHSDWVTTVSPGKLLDVPVEMIRDDPSLDLPFYLYWANESWRKTWFGQDNTVVWEQKYGTEKDWRIQFDYCLEYFKDKRYIKIDGKPVYAIYNAWAIPEQEKFLSLWDEWAKEAGLLRASACWTSWRSCTRPTATA